MRPQLIALLFITSLVLSGCTTPADADRTQLTAAEVQSTFIGRKWRSPGGTFLFNSSTYTYWPNSGRRLDANNYEMLPDGTLHGASTSYTFYRNEDGTYSYYHSRTKRMIPAFVR
ncbi:MAG: hypothetical protein GY792_08580 [Gammaproteobacteria bacterium]|nr:hypothetical protein [Gammaproteobacteria bacterium]